MVNRSQNLLLIIFVIILGIAGGYIYYSAIGLSSAVPIPELPVKEKDSLVSFKDLELNLSVSSEKLNQLRIFGESPVNPGTSGRNNPFAPF